MKWFKHSALAAQDAKLKKLRIKYGMQGYGLYWYCLELIASEVDSNKLTFELEHDSEILAHDTGINYQVVQEMMQYMVELGLFENTGGIITCFALAKRADEYLIKSLKREKKLDALEKVRTMSGHTPDKVRPDKIRVDKIRSDKSREKQKASPAEKPDSFSDEIKAVFEHWKHVMGKTNKIELTQRRASKVRARLKEGHTVEQICQAIDGCAMSPFHMGDNDTGAVHDDLELICRNDSKIKMFTAIRNNPQSRGSSMQSEQYYQSLQNKQFN